MLAVKLNGLRTVDHRASADGRNPGDGTDTETQGLLLRSEAADGPEPFESRTVAFAPTPPPRNGSGLHESAGQTMRDRFRHRSAASFASDASDLSPPLPVDSLNGIPYASLVCLGLPDSPYSFGFSRAHSDGSLPKPGGVLRS